METSITQRYDKKIIGINLKSKKKTLITFHFHKRKRRLHPQKIDLRQ